jgi:hypothetical protein
MVKDYAFLNGKRLRVTVGQNSYHLGTVFRGKELDAIILKDVNQY